MKYCTHCGKQLLDEAVICVGCGCPVVGASIQTGRAQPIDRSAFLSSLSERLLINGIIWLVVGVLQILIGVGLENWWIGAVGAMNIIAGIQDMRYSKALFTDPAGIMDKFTPLVGPIIALVYNVIFGGVFGVAGSIFYFVGIRGYIMANKEAYSANSVPQRNAYCGLKGPVVITPAPVGMWACQYCGTHNKSTYGQCKKCGQYRGK
jgi:hypothetical protein